MKFRQGFGREIIQLPGRGVGFDLSVPHLSIEPSEPQAKLGKLSLGELLNRGFDGLH